MQNHERFHVCRMSSTSQAFSHFFSASLSNVGNTRSRNLISYTFAERLIQHLVKRAEVLSDSHSISCR